MAASKPIPNAKLIGKEFDEIRKYLENKKVDVTNIEFYEYHIELNKLKRWTNIKPITFISGDLDQTLDVVEKEKQAIKDFLLNCNINMDNVPFEKYHEKLNEVRYEFKVSVPHDSKKSDVRVNEQEQPLNAVPGEKITVTISDKPGFTHAYVRIEPDITVDTSVPGQLSFDMPASDVKVVIKQEAQKFKIIYPTLEHITHNGPEEASTGDEIKIKFEYERNWGFSSGPMTNVDDAKFINNKLEFTMPPNSVTISATEAPLTAWNITWKVDHIANAVDTLPKQFKKGSSLEINNLAAVQNYKFEDDSSKSIRVYKTNKVEGSFIPVPYEITGSKIDAYGNTIEVNLKVNIEGIEDPITIELVPRQITGEEKIPTITVTSIKEISSSGSSVELHEAKLYINGLLSKVGVSYRIRMEDQNIVEVTCKNYKPYTKVFAQGEIVSDTAMDITLARETSSLKFVINQVLGSDGVDITAKSHLWIIVGNEGSFEGPAHNIPYETWIEKGTTYKYKLTCTGYVTKEVQAVYNEELPVEPIILQSDSVRHTLTLIPEEYNKSTGRRVKVEGCEFNYYTYSLNNWTKSNSIDVPYDANVSYKIRKEGYIQYSSNINVRKDTEFRPLMERKTKDYKVTIDTIPSSVAATEKILDISTGKTYVGSTYLNEGDEYQAWSEYPGYLRTYYKETSSGVVSNVTTAVTNKMTKSPNGKSLRIKLIENVTDAVIIPSGVSTSYGIFEIKSASANSYTSLRNAVKYNVAANKEFRVRFDLDSNQYYLKELVIRERDSRGFIVSGGFQAIWNQEKSVQVSNSENYYNIVSNRYVTKLICVFDGVPQLNDVGMSGGNYLSLDFGVAKLPKPSGSVPVKLLGTIADNYSPIGTFGYRHPDTSSYKNVPANGEFSAYPNKQLYFRFDLEDTYYFVGATIEEFDSRGTVTKPEWNRYNYNGSESSKLSQQENWFRLNPENRIVKSVLVYPKLGPVHQAGNKYILKFEALNRDGSPIALTLELKGNEENNELYDNKRERSWFE